MMDGFVWCLLLFIWQEVQVANLCALTDFTLQLSQKSWSDEREEREWFMEYVIGVNRQF